MPFSNEDNLKPIVKFIAFVALLVASIVVACRARHYQLVNQQMPNWKGGFMSPNDGYLLAVILLLLSVAALITAYKSWKGPS